MRHAGLTQQYRVGWWDRWPYNQVSQEKWLDVPFWCAWAAWFAYLEVCGLLLASVIALMLPSLVNMATLLSITFADFSWSFFMTVTTRKAHVYWLASTALPKESEYGRVDTFYSAQSESPYWQRQLDGQTGYCPVRRIDPSMYDLPVVATSVYSTVKKSSESQKDLERR